jgi:hypothetical protein
VALFLGIYTNSQIILSPVSGSKLLKQPYKTAMDFMGNYISGSTESKECQALFQTLAEIPGRDQEI